MQPIASDTAQHVRTLVRQVVPGPVGDKESPAGIAAHESKLVGKPDDAILPPSHDGNGTSEGSVVVVVVEEVRLATLQFVLVGLVPGTAGSQASQDLFHDARSPVTDRLAQMGTEIVGSGVEPPWLCRRR